MGRTQKYAAVIIRRILRLYVRQGADAVKEKYNITPKTIRRYIHLYPQYYLKLLQYWEVSEHRTLSAGDAMRVAKIVKFPWIELREERTGEEFDYKNWIPADAAEYKAAVRDCWLCTKSIKDSGYSRIRVGSKDFYMHRLMFELYTKYKPAAEEVLLHSCDIRHCCNPYHLTPGTKKENTADMQAKLRDKFRGRKSGVEKIEEFDTLLKMLGQ